MSERQPWFCPSCQKHHAPHVDTCPRPVDLISTTPAPVIHPWPYQTPPGPLADEYRRAVDYDPCAGCKGICGNAACPKRVTIAYSAINTPPQGWSEIIVGSAQ